MASAIASSSRDPVTLRFTTNKLVRDREVVSFSSGSIEDRALTSRCHSLVLFYMLPLSSYTTALENARIRGITNFEIFLKEKYGKTAYVCASIVLNIRLVSLKSSRSPLLLADALLLQKQTEFQFQQMLALTRHVMYYYIARYPAYREFIEENNGLDCSLARKAKYTEEWPLLEEYDKKIVCSLAQIISEIENLPTIPKKSAVQVQLLAEAVLTSLPISYRNAEIDRRIICNAIVGTLRLKGFEIKKPDIFMQVNRLFGTPKWWECFTGVGNSHADQAGIHTFKIYLESLFSLPTVFIASRDEGIDLRTCESLTQAKAKKIYNRARHLQARGNLFYSYLLENYGIVATHTTLGLMKVTIESINHSGISLFNADMKKLAKLAATIKLRFSYNIFKEYRALRFYFLFHVMPFPPEAEESKAPVDDGKLFFSQLTIRKKIEEIPYLNFNSSELTALSAHVFEKIKDRHLTIYEMEILIVKTILSHVARTQGKTIDEIRSAKLLVPEPPLLKKLITQLGTDLRHFIEMLERTPLENWTPTDLVKFYSVIKKDYEKP